MNEVDKKELRRLAECASSGPWVAEMEGGRMNVANEDWYLLEMHHDQPLFMTDAAFIAAANPAAILALLDDLEKEKSRVAELEIENLPIDMLRISYQAHKALAEEAGCETIEQLAEQRDAALSELEQYRKDAERYRHYRLGMVSPELFDSSIDAAMAKDHAQ